MTINDGISEPIAKPNGLAIDPIDVAKSRCFGANQRAANNAVIFIKIGVAIAGKI